MMLSILAYTLLQTDPNCFSYQNQSNPLPLPASIDLSIRLAPSLSLSLFLSSRQGWEEDAEPARLRWDGEEGRAVSLVTRPARVGSGV